MTDAEIEAAFAAPHMKQLAERYHAAAHAMQTGVALEMSKPGRTHATEPKHLRVGVNSALVEASAIGMALMRKGILTPEEYFGAIVEKMEAEAAAYESRLNDGLPGAPIKLA